MPTERGPNEFSFEGLPLDFTAEVRSPRDESSLCYASRLMATQQILPLLGPGDLLSLSRTSKALRSYLLRSEVKTTLWIPALNKAYAKEGLPNCPDWFKSELQFIDFMYTEHCQVSCYISPRSSEVIRLMLTRSAATSPMGPVYGLSAVKYWSVFARTVSTKGT